MDQGYGEHFPPLLQVVMSHPDVPPQTYLCTCSKCEKSKWVGESGASHRGKLFKRAATVQNHEADDQIRKNALIAQNEERVAAAIFLSAATSSQPSSLPVRPRDRDEEDSHEDKRSSNENVQLDAIGPLQASGPATSEEDAPRRRQHKGRLQRLAAIESLLQVQRQRIPDNLVFHFASPPTAADDPVGELGDGGENATYLGARGIFAEYLKQLEDMDAVGDRDLDRRLEVLKQRARDYLAMLERRKEDAWSLEVATAVLSKLPANLGPIVASQIERPGSYARSLQPWLLAGLLMTAVLHALAAAARVDLQYVLRTLQVTIYGAFVYCNVASRLPPSPTPDQQKLLEALPSDIRTVLTRLGLEPDILRFAACPRCHRTYAPDQTDKVKLYPSHCKNKETDKEPCGQSLLDENGVPLKPYPYHSALSWLNALGARSELLQLARAAWGTTTKPPSRWKDIWDAPLLRQFLGPDGQTPFSVQPDGSVHLVFSLFIDWFNPFGNKKAGKSHSIGAIYLVCLNLPPHLRYRPENVYLVGIIPGPHEPELHQINHYIRPLIDEFLALWHKGFYLSDGTTDWLIRAAIVPLVCDLPALRKTAGFAGHSSHRFCSFCLLNKKDIDNLDRSSWRRRSREDHYECARRWRDADTEKERARLFDKYGVRWSELLRLPYWDPTRFALVDAMHNLFLGELRHHCRDVWGLNVKDNAPNKTKSTPHSPEEQQEWLDHLVAHLKSRSKSKMMRVRRGYIVATAEHNGVIPPSTDISKGKCVAALLEWWSKNTTNDIRIPPVLPYPTSDFHIVRGDYDISKNNILDQPTITQVRSDIARTFFPSWLERPPRNFGSPSHGKLKADHWRTVCTVSLVITLVRLWGSTSTSPTENALLENFVHLVSAVDLATRRSIDQDQIDRFDDHMSKYVAGLQRLFDWHHLVPNHHLSLHLKECLENFGPVHAWWAFPFERFNGLLQGLNTNSKSNAMPLTFMRYFYLGANLRWLMASIKWPDLHYFKEMVAAFNGAFKNAARGTRVADFRPLDRDEADTAEQGLVYDDTQAISLPPAVYDSLVRRISAMNGPTSFASLFAGATDKRPRLSTEGQYITSFGEDVIKFSPHTKHARNSFITFRSPDDSPTSYPRAGRIQNIFLHVRLEGGKRIVEPFFIVEEYLPLSVQHASLDPYRKFRDLETRLFYDRCEPSPRVLAFPDICAHFAAFFYKPSDVGEACVVVRSLDRVRSICAQS